MDSLKENSFFNFSFYNTKKKQPNNSKNKISRITWKDDIRF